MKLIDESVLKSKEAKKVLDLIILNKENLSYFNLEVKVFHNGIELKQ